MTLNTDTIGKLLQNNRNNPEILSFLKTTLDSFEQYHQAVFDEQMFRIVFTGALDADEYKDRLTALDRTRTVHHNSVIANIGILNRMATNAGLPPVYDGTVSEERPYRRQIADAVFAWLEEIFRNRN